MDSGLKRLVEGFANNPVASGKLLQRMLLDDPQQFFVDSLPLLRHAPDSQGFHYVLALLHSQNLILKNLCDPALFSKAESIALARRMARVEPLFDMKLAKILLATEDKNQGIENRAGLRLLEIMSEVSDRGRSLLVAQLLHHPNPQVRSKAALLVGKSTQDAKWVSQRMGEADSRVRANAVEALWGVESEDCRQIFLNALEDPANRVVGNGVLGLYRLGVPTAIGSLLTMISHPDESFQKTGIWVMGESGDLRFLPVLARLMRESSPALRSYIFRAFAKLKQKRSRLAAQPPLLMHALVGAKPLEDAREIGVSVRFADGMPATGLKATQFAVWEKNELVSDYSVRPVAEKEPLSIAFAVPRNDEPLEAPSAQERALGCCLDMKRKVDAWVILQYCQSPEPQPCDVAEESGSELRLTKDIQALHKAIHARVARSASARGPLSALTSLMPVISRAAGRGHVVFLDDGCSAFPDAPHLQSIADAARTAEVTIHTVSQRETALRQISLDTGGQWLAAAAPEELPQLLAGLYGYLAANYQLRYKTGSAGDLRIEVTTEQGLGEVNLRP